MPPSSASWSSVSSSSTLGLRAAPTSPRQPPSSGSSSSEGRRRGPPGRGLATDGSRMAATLRRGTESCGETPVSAGDWVRLSLPRRDHVSRGRGRGAPSRDGRPWAGPGESRRAPALGGWTELGPRGAWPRRWLGLLLMLEEGRQRTGDEDRRQCAHLPSREEQRTCCVHQISCWLKSQPLLGLMDSSACVL